MESIPTYIDCFDKSIPTPKTVFDLSSDNASSQPFQTALSQQSPFLQAGFPLLNNNQHIIQTSSSTNTTTTTTPYLFDQAILQSLDDYIAEPYLHATQKLRVVLYESCSLMSHLCRIASIYLMLEDELMHIFCEMLFQKASTESMLHWILCSFIAIIDGQRHISREQQHQYSDRQAFYGCKECSWWLTSRFNAFRMFI